MFSKMSSHSAILFVGDIVDPNVGIQDWEERSVHREEEKKGVFCCRRRGCISIRPVVTIYQFAEVRHAKESYGNRGMKRKKGGGGGGGPRPCGARAGATAAHRLGVGRQHLQ